jgi:lipid-binding SYLF domain-containing protein
MNTEMLAYSRSHGVFAGVDLSGGTLKPDKEADARAYGSEISARDIVMGTKKVPAPAQASVFLRALESDVRATSGRK